MIKKVGLMVISVLLIKTTLFSQQKYLTFKEINKYLETGVMKDSIQDSTVYLIDIPHSDLVGLMTYSNNGRLNKRNYRKVYSNRYWYKSNFYKTVNYINHNMTGAKMIGIGYENRSLYACHGLKELLLDSMKRYDTITKNLVLSYGYYKYDQDFTDFTIEKLSMKIKNEEYFMKLFGKKSSEAKNIILNFTSRESLSKDWFKRRISPFNGSPFVFISDKLVNEMIKN